MQDKPIRLIELFAGYGSQALALKRLGVDFENYRVVEFDKYAIKSYNAVHNTNFEVMDIRDIKGEDLGIVELDKYDYVLTYSFPCTDLSLAGNRAGMSRDSGTRSGLLWEVERILRELSDGQKLSLPQFLLMENVPQVHGEKNINDFAEWIAFLDSLGYTSKWQDLNAKDYGVAQNRERCFLISYLDKSLKFAFPQPVKLEKVARDYLEDTVDEKYYLNTEKAQELINKLILENGDADTITLRSNTEEGFVEVDNGGVVDLTYPTSTSRRGRAQTRGRVCPTIASAGEISKVEKITRVIDLSITEPKYRDRANSIKTAQRGIETHNNKETGVFELVKVELGESAKTRAFLNYNGIESINEDIAKTLASRDYKGFGSGFTTQNGVIDVASPPTSSGLGEMKSNDKNGHKPQYYQQDRVYSSDCVAMTHPAQIPEGSYKYLVKENYQYRIRKLTPLECFRLMDVDDEDALKMLSVNSETQCYKQAGNSIVVSVLEAIFKNMLLGGSEQTKAQIDIFDILE